MNQEPKPPASRVVDDIRSKILSGELPAGAKLPSYEKLGIEYEVDKNTAARAIGILRDERFVYTHQGKGTFVMDIENRLNGTESPEELLRNISQQMQALHARVEDIESRLEAFEHPQGR